MTCPPDVHSATEVGGSAERIDHVFQHLLADHDVPRSPLRRRVAEVEFRIVERVEMLPTLVAMCLAADLDRGESLGPERGDEPVELAVHDDALPLVVGTRGFRENEPVDGVEAPPSNTAHLLHSDDVTAGARRTDQAAKATLDHYARRA